MSIQIQISWDYISPFLRIVKGTVYLYHISQSPSFERHPILKYNVMKEDSCIQFNSIDGEPSMYSDLFNLFREDIVRMVETYFDGIVMKPNSYSWIEPIEDNMCYEDLIEKKKMTFKECVERMEKESTEDKNEFKPDRVYLREVIDENSSKF